MENENANLNNQPTNTTSPQLSPPSQPEAPQPKSNKGLIIFLVILVLVLAGTTAYFAYKSMQTPSTDNQQLPQPTTQPTIQPTSPSPTQLPNSTPTTNPTSSWETYSNTQAGFSIKHPMGWRKAESDNWVGFGPQEIGEDVLWGVSFYNKSEKTIVEIKDDVGDQFSDRQQTEESITLNGLPATKVITTTNQFKDWYSVIIIIDTGNMLYSIGNGAQSDEALNKMLTTRTDKEYDLSFEDFYSSFMPSKSN